MSITILLLGREYALVDKGLPKQGSLLYHPKQCMIGRSPKKLPSYILVHVCSERFPEKYGSYFCWPQEQLEQTNTSPHGKPGEAPWSRWRLPTTSLVIAFQVFKWRAFWASYIDQWVDVYIYIYIHLHIIYIYIVILYICICICTYINYTLDISQSQSCSKSKIHKEPLQKWT